MSPINPQMTMTAFDLDDYRRVRSLGVVHSFCEPRSMIPPFLRTARRPAHNHEHAHPASTGSGPGFSDPAGLALDGDRLLLSALGSLGSALFAVDLASGERTIFSDSSTGAGVRASFGGLALHGTHVIVASQVLQALVAVDPRSGDRVIASR